MTIYRIVRHFNSRRYDTFTQHTFRRIYPTLEAAIRMAHKGTRQQGAFLYQDIVFEVIDDRFWIPRYFADSH